MPVQVVPDASRPEREHPDNGYCGKLIRDFFRRRDIRFTIAKRSNMCRKGPFDSDSTRQRNQVERAINRYKQFRHIATRYEKMDASYRAMWIIAFTLLSGQGANCNQLIRL